MTLRERIAPPLHGDVDRVVFYQDTKSKWRWRYLAANNGHILADSGQGYRRFEDARTAANRVTNRHCVEMVVFDYPTEVSNGFIPGDIQAVVWR